MRLEQLSAERRVVLVVEESLPLKADGAALCDSRAEICPVITARLRTRLEGVVRYPDMRGRRGWRTYLSGNLSVLYREVGHMGRIFTKV